MKPIPMWLVVFVYGGGVRPPHAKYDWSQFVAAGLSVIDNRLSLRPDNHQLWILSQTFFSDEDHDTFDVKTLHYPLRNYLQLTEGFQYRSELVVNRSTEPGLAIKVIDFRKIFRAVCISVVHSQEVRKNTWYQTQISTFFAAVLSWTGWGRQEM